jgi:hypothetical protein
MTWLLIISSILDVSLDCKMLDKKLTQSNCCGWKSTVISKSPVQHDLTGRLLTVRSCCTGDLLITVGFHPQQLDGVSFLSNILQSRDTSRILEIINSQVMFNWWFTDNSRLLDVSLDCKMLDKKLTQSNCCGWKSTVISKSPVQHDLTVSNLQYPRCVSGL